MLLFKSILNGIGTGAGFAWPLFGIVFNVVGASIGGVFSLTLGSITVGLFILIGGGICYLSYHKGKEEQKLFRALLEKNEQKLIQFIEKYLKLMFEEHQATNKTTSFKIYLIARIDQQLLLIAHDKEQIPLHQTLKFIKATVDQPNFTQNSILLSVKQQIKTHSSVPFSMIVIAALGAFVAAFGSITGCSAGIAGLFTGLGLFSSMAAFPIIGWSVLVIAVSISLFAAGGAIVEARAHYRNHLLNQTIKTMYQHLKKKVSDWSNLSFEKDATAGKPPQNFPSLFEENTSGMEKGLESEPLYQSISKCS
jgi:hypothetical protein